VLDGETGYLVPPRDPEALAAAITKILREPGLAVSMGRAGYDWASGAGDWGEIAAQTVQVYLAAWHQRHGDRI
jgi:glycosyltransferase involved in cell wall biosynthesis